MDRIVEGTSSQAVLTAFEKRIAKLERQRISLLDKAEKIVPEQETLGDFIEPALGFLGSPWKIYQKSELALKKRC